MNEALKKESSVLDEFEIPEHLGGVVEDLKKEQQTISKEIESVKAESTVRKQDESTKVFNIRQHQMEMKLAELEEKKKKSERELQSILQQKNSTLHADLKKLAQFILQETRKITPQIKDVDAKITSVISLKNELQQVFESNLSDRKTNMQMIEEQNIFIHQLGDQLRETSKLLQGDFHFLTKDLEKIQQEKQDEARKLSALKQEVSHHQGLADEIDSRKRDLREIEHKISLGEKNALAFARLDDELAALKSEVVKLQEERERLHTSNIRLHQEEFHGQEELARLKLREKHLDQVISGKKDQLQRIEADILDVRKRLEMRKNDEHEVHTKFLHHRDQLVQLQNEIARLEGARASYHQMLDESATLFTEKKEFYQRELELLQKLHESKALELEATFEAKKARWDEEFRVYTEARKSELKTELDAIDKKDLEDIRNKKRDLLNDVSRITASVLSAEGFTSTEEKTKTARKEIEKAFELVFGKTRRWKIW